ncbi:MAG: DUF3108 domain-containing protein [Fidelibacterota bacterium]
MSKVLTMLSLGMITSISAGDIPFSIGETLEYDLKVNIIKAGSAMLKVIGEEEINGNPTYHIRYTAKSNRFVDPLFYVRDRVNSWLDKEGLFTRQLKKNIHEGSYRYKLKAYVNYKDSTVTSGNEVLPINSVIRDPFSLFYYLRSIQLKVGQQLSFVTYDNNQFVDFQIIVHRKENVRVPAGRFQCLVIEPYRKGKTLFKQKGDMRIWLTDDERRLPVKIETKSTFGSMTMLLKKISP